MHFKNRNVSVAGVFSQVLLGVDDVFVAHTLVPCAFHASSILEFGVASSKPPIAQGTNDSHPPPMLEVA